MTAKEFLKSKGGDITEAEFEVFDMETIYKFMEEYHKAKLEEGDIDLCMFRMIIQYFDREAVAINLNNKELEEVYDDFKKTLLK